MPLSPSQWHDRYRQQAGWTRHLRKYLLSRLELDFASRVVEVGCGTGAMLSELGEMIIAGQYGLDIDINYLHLAKQHALNAQLTQGDAHYLPYKNSSFDAACCHFLLLWVHDPVAVVAEMARVTRPGGAILLMAEPDYGGRIDYPNELGILGQWQSQGLRQMGANPEIGRRLAALLSRAGLVGIESGVLGGEWSEPSGEAEWEMEWQVLRSDLENLPGILSIHQVEIDDLQAIDHQAWSRGERVLFVPTFYAWGRKPGDFPQSNP